MKKLYTLLFLGLVLLAVPSISHAEEAVEIAEQLDQTVTIQVIGNSLRIAGGNGQVLQIYNVAGVCVYSLRVDGNDRRYELNLRKGCYIVKVGRTVRKIALG
ncbi:MAG: T9SS C-terminal target domain-containing protein [Prevotella sp.]|nr:T9SS C-terminal target domain-containing protein [Prevotella sp.]